MIKDLVSIISPCYNGEKYLENFLNSVLKQTYEKVELIVIDDGSTDNTMHILEKYRVFFKERGYIYKYYHQENKGQAAAINRGLEIYQGEYLMWVDSDDILLENNLKKKVEFLKNNPEYGIVLCEGEIVNEKDLNTGIGSLKRKRPKKKDELFEDLIYEKNVVFCPGVIMTRRENIKKALPKNSIYESRQGQNLQLLLPLAYKYKCGYIEENLFKCVAHKDSHSRVKRSYREQILRYGDFEVLLIETIKRIDEMPKQEKEKWEIKIKEKYDICKLHLAYSRFKFNDACQIKKKLESYVKKKPWKYSYIRYICLVLRDAIMSKCRRITKYRRKSRIYA